MEGTDETSDPHNPGDEQPLLLLAGGAKASTDSSKSRGSGSGAGAGTGPPGQHEKAWMQRYYQLVQYRQNRGHCRVPQRTPEYRQLGRWVEKQRERRKKGRLQFERIRLLDELSFYWGTQHRRGGGDGGAGASEGGGDAGGGGGANASAAAAVNYANDEDVRMLNSSNYGVADPSGTRLAQIIAWKDSSEAIKKEEVVEDVVAVAATGDESAAAPGDEGDDDVDQPIVADDDNDEDEAAVASSTVAADEQPRPEMYPGEKEWMDMFDKLRMYKRENGDTLVPMYCPEEPKLGLWVHEQRMEMKKLFQGRRSKLKWEQLANLERLGFKFTVRGH